ncbi:helix-turn-helix domain-containing protein [Candidatus Poriferisodalis sp.]|uniref:helix-turn-helix domain-containing protein n=1 Tax=Candidatus Poriferisodalis sp. TaxID=3101277 RepID=UPI003B024F0E
MSSRSFRNIQTVGQFGIEVRRLREAAELTQAALAAQAGVSRRWLGRLERGHTGAELANIMRLARALGLSLRFAESPAP